ncbi:PD40 domain-containing protein [Aquimarina mytili]|uniref:PD40 domain-containing protein n=1 Tax=Aquimarina mytili TaxID=874423 RepID=A0A936ZVV0_9FLAO|nr:PD40 domain-containing protein [Aquimarina mytili]MBL0682935.1 PD40 domain-containing protein [Aquimarina mytili]
MKNYNSILLLLILTLLLSACNTKKKDATANNPSTIENLYFGQQPSGLTPEIFAPGIISITGRNESNISFSPGLDEVYFTVNKKDEDVSIYFSKLKDNKWTPAKRANFTKGRKKEEMYPFVSFDEKRIYFTALDSIFSDEKIWYVNRLEDSWSDAIQLDSPLNDDQVFYINQAKNGDLFYTNLSKRWKTYVAPNKNGKFLDVQEVELEFGDHGFISPSQDYLLVHTRNKENEKRKDLDIYVCFKEKDGTWAKPINLGNTVNSTVNEGNPSISPDGKYFFFTRSNIEDGLSDLYWVSTEVIEKLRPKL